MADPWFGGGGPKPPWYREPLRLCLAIFGVIIAGYVALVVVAVILRGIFG